MSNIDFEIGDGQPGGDRHPLPRRAARLPQPHGLPHRLGPRRRSPDRQRGRRPPLLRRPLRHPHRQHLAVLAVHADRLDVRGPARRGDPRAHGRPDARPRHVPQRARRRSTSTAPTRDSALGQGQPVRERLAGRASSSATRTTRHPGRLRERGVRRRAGLRALPREREDRGRRRAPIYRVKDFNYGLVVPGLGTIGHLDTHYRRRRRSPHCRRRCRRRSARCRRSTQWVNVRTLGVKGDGETDDTAAHPDGDRHAPRALLPDRLLHRPRHDHAEARHGADRAASRH